MVNTADTSASERRVGRPSKARERRAQIFTAATEVIAADGLSGLTTTKVADAAGLKRTLVNHYFSSRDALVEEYLSYAVARYGEAMIEYASAGSVDEALTALLADDAYPEPKHLTAWLDLVVASSRDHSVRQRLNWLWSELWLPKMRSLIEREHGHADDAQLNGAAFTVTALIEAYWAFRAQETTDHTIRRQQVLAACRTLLDSLD